ncbi:MAG: DUF4290 domain-containing protein [Bacteroidales bacterium]|nr:DUF4290 domain-containing protein [Bacteroidales bacterium]MBQ6729364.1 DUF4290 domain-containing protein [Bacteroidales bacterium]
MDKQGLLYNTERGQIIISEYGRNMQEMIRHLMEIEDRQKRTEAANFIISIMAQMNPQVKQSDDYIHKLWDHLYIISDYQLDVDSPFPAPEPMSEATRPQHVGYQNNKIEYGHYGHYMAKMIELAAQVEDEEMRHALSLSIANQMKRNYVEWGGNVVSDQQIIADLKAISKGRLVLDEETKLNGAEAIQKPGQQGQGKKKKKKKQSNLKADMNNPNNPAYKKRKLQ